MKTEMLISTHSRSSLAVKGQKLGSARLGSAHVGEIKVKLVGEVQLEVHVCLRKRLLNPLVVCVHSKNVPATYTNYTTYTTATPPIQHTHARAKMGRARRC